MEASVAAVGGVLFAAGRTSWPYGDVGCVVDDVVESTSDVGETMAGLVNHELTSV